MSGLRRLAPLGLASVATWTALSTALPSPARAAPPAPSARAAEGPAAQAEKVAKSLFASGDFRGALENLTRAYELSREPRLLYDMALCQRNLHAYARMQALLQQYEREAGGTLTQAERAAVDSALAAIASFVGQVRLAVTPDGAAVSVDGGAVGTTPMKDAVALDPGPHTVKIEKAGFVPVVKSVEIKEGRTSDLAVDLTALGGIAVATDDAASVAIDGKGVGKERQQVSPGLHLVRVTAPGKRAYESEVEVRAGENRTLDVTLEEARRPLWPFILGGAVVVTAGAIVGGYFIANPTTHTTPPPAGTFGTAHLTSLRFR